MFHFLLHMSEVNGVVRCWLCVYQGGLSHLSSSDSVLTYSRILCSSGRNSTHISIDSLPGIIILPNSIGSVLGYDSPTVILSSDESIRASGIWFLSCVVIFSVFSDMTGVIFSWTVLSGDYFFLVSANGSVYDCLISFSWWSLTRLKLRALYRDLATPVYSSFG